MILENPRGLDPDLFGSFCRRRPRLQETGETCRTKTEADLDLTGLILGLGSEGNVGPHPSLPRLAAGLECLTVLDREAALVIQEWAISARTNFSQLETRHVEAIDGWLRPRPQAAGPPGVASRCSRPTSTPRC